MLVGLPTVVVLLNTWMLEGGSGLPAAVQALGIAMNPAEEEVARLSATDFVYPWEATMLSPTVTDSTKTGGGENSSLIETDSPKFNTWLQEKGVQSDISTISANVLFQ